ncbi:GNAT family N-acetyltransferase [Streptomyces nigrescens]|uniref:GNAT family N-acetyltransferase n=1 Tax=Streptomyces nigrescens TaxID=1920 RepID=UPI0036F6D0EB
MLKQADWSHTTSRCAVVPLPLDVASLSKSLRRQHVQRERRVAAAGHFVSFRRTRTTRELLDSHAMLETLYAARWAASTPVASAAATYAAWTEVLRRLGNEAAFIASAEINGTPIALQLCLYRGDRCYSVRPAMHPDMLHLSPGHLLLRRLIENLAADGFRALDLGRTVESTGQIGYKGQYGPSWGETVTSVIDGPVEQQRRVQQRTKQFSR